jgi:hypothetical protein
MKAYWGVVVYFHEFLTSALDEGEWSTSCRGRFAPRERASNTHWIGDWVGSRAGLDTVVKRNSQPLPGLEFPIIQPVTQRCTTVLSRLRSGGRIPHIYNALIR